MNATTYAPPNPTTVFPPIKPKKKSRDLSSSELVLGLRHNGEFFIAWAAEYRGNWAWYYEAADYDGGIGPEKTTDIIAWWNLPTLPTSTTRPEPEQSV